AVGARSGVATVEANRTAAPLTGEAEDAPRVDGGSVATTQGLGKDRVDLGQGQPLEGVVLVDVDGESVQADAQEGGSITKSLFKSVDLISSHLAGHRAKLRRAGDKGGSGCARTLSLDLDAHVGVVLAKAFGPEGHHVVHGVRTHG